jgi:hypothetical protein
VKRLLFLIVVSAGLWSAYWLYGASGTRAAFATWFEERRAAGWAADVSALEVRGFPNRFDTTFTDLSLADPATGWAWDAPFFQLLALSYKPNHVIAVWPDSQQIATPQDRFTLTQAEMQASVVLWPSAALALDRVRLVADTVQVTASDGSTTAASALRLAAERLGPEGQAATTAPGTGPTRYRIALSAEGFAPDTGLRQRLDVANRLPRTLDALRADVTLGFDRPWTRLALEEARPQPRLIALRLAEARWGELELLAAGDLEIDDSGMASGRITVKARNWREILAMARASGQLPEGLVDTLEQGLGLLAGRNDGIDIPLDFRRGMIWLGPVPVMASPDFRLR